MTIQMCHTILQNMTPQPNVVLRAPQSPLVVAHIELEIVVHRIQLFQLYFSIGIPS